MSKTEKFLERARAVHGDKYSYINMVYVNSTTKVTITCPHHGDFTQLPNNHYRGSGCPKCKSEKTKQTNLARYGCAHPLQNIDVYKKQEQTCFNKYGTSRPAQNNNIAEKTKQTNLIRYGVSCTQKDPSVRNKTKATNLLKRGVEWVTQDVEWQAAVKQSIMKTYGVENVSQLSECRHKVIATMQQLYGVSNFNQLLTKHAQYQLNDHEWMYHQYITLGKTANVIAAELGVSQSTVTRSIHKLDIDIKSIGWYSYKCIQWLMSFNNSNIQHALNGGEYAIPSTRYHADGYDPYTNTIYEFHGDVYHGNPALFNANQLCHPFSSKTAGELYNHTIEKERTIKELGYNLVVMWEHDYNSLVQQNTNNKR